MRSKTSFLNLSSTRQGQNTKELSEEYETNLNDTKKLLKNI